LTDQTKAPSVPEDGTIDYLCAPCDVDTMARRLNLDKRRVQQLAKEWLGAKNERGEYNCPRMVTRYSQTLQTPKRSKASGLTKKQEESLDIRNARDRAEVLREWEVMVHRPAVVEELAPLFLSVRNGMRGMANTLPKDIKTLVREYVEKIKNGEEVRDYEIEIAARKLLLEKINENLTAFSKGISAYVDGSEAEGVRAGRVAKAAGKFWQWVRKRFA
jgi:hypothetical protein